jgi:hypothetical protein
LKKVIGVRKRGRGGEGEIGREREIRRRGEWERGREGDREIRR